MFFANLKVGARLSVGFASILFLLVLVTLIGITRMNALQKDLQEFTRQDLQMIESIGHLQTLALRQGVLVRELILQETVAKQNEATKALRDSYKTFDEAIAGIDKVAAVKDARDMEFTKQIVDRQAKLRPLLKDVSELVDNTEFDVAKKTVNEKISPLQAELLGLFDEFRKHLEGEAQQAAAAAEKSYKTALAVMLALAAVAIAVGVAVGFLVTRSITQPLSRSVAFARRVADGDLSARIQASGRDELAELLRALDEMSRHLASTVSSIRTEADKVSTSASSLSGETDRVANRADVQSDRIMTVSASLEQMSVATTEVNTGAAGVSEAANRAKELSEQGNDDMERNLRVVQGIVQAVNSSGKEISELSVAIGRINEIASVIKEIADQTNLLALNAAIEAARAGEQGRGFAVVADEVRKLAERTSASTADISNMIDDIGVRTGRTVASMEKVRQDVETGADYTRNVGEKLRLILDAVSHVSNLASHIAEATQEQRGASEQTAKSMEEINCITDETHAAIQQVETASREMVDSASELQRLVASFRIA